MKIKVYNLVLGLFLIGQFGCTHKRLTEKKLTVQTKGEDDISFLGSEEELKHFIKISKEEGYVLKKETNFKATFVKELKLFYEDEGEDADEPTCELGVDGVQEVEFRAALFVKKSPGRIEDYRICTFPKEYLPTAKLVNFRCLKCAPAGLSLSLEYTAVAKMRIGEADPNSTSVSFVLEI